MRGFIIYLPLIEKMGDTLKVFLFAEYFSPEAIIMNIKMFAFTTTGDENGTAAKEAALCESCKNDPQNVAYCQEMASQSDDLNPESNMVDCSDNHELNCCICNSDMFGNKD